MPNTLKRLRTSAFLRQHGRCIYCHKPMWLSDPAHLSILIAAATHSHKPPPPVRADRRHPFSLTAATQAGDFPCICGRATGLHKGNLVQTFWTSCMWVFLLETDQSIV